MDKNIAMILMIPLILCLPGFSDTEKIEIVTAKSHESYMISRQGVFFPDQFDTIFVFGHIDKESVAKEIVEYLNKTESGNVFEYRRFHRSDKTQH